MRPDVAQAFDRMAAAAVADGVALVISSAFRSDAEQAVLFARHPDPKWVARPGTSLHRNGTELDLGPAPPTPGSRRTRHASTSFRGTRAGARRRAPRRRARVEREPGMPGFPRQFGTVPLALAAYNAGPAPVSGCGCVPAFPETRGYVARILGLMNGAGEDLSGGASAGLEVRLVH